MTDTTPNLPDGMVREDPPVVTRTRGGKYNLKQKLLALKQVPGEWYRIHSGKDPQNLVYQHLRAIAGPEKDAWKKQFEVRSSRSLPNGEPMPDNQSAVWVRYIGD